MAEKLIHLIITRQDSPDSTPYKEEFKIPYRPGMNVIGALMEIQRNPLNAQGQKLLRSTGNRTAWKKYAARARWSSTEDRARLARR